MVGETRVPNNFLEAGDAVVNVSFTDFASGKGVVEFFFGSVNGENRLSNTAFFSETINKADLKTTGSDEERLIDEDFDADFLKTVTIEGEALFNIPIGASTDATNTMTYRVVIIVKKFDGTTETVIATATGKTYTIASGLDNQIFIMTSTSVDLPRTIFKNGDSLRLTVEIFAQRVGGSGATQAVMIADPKGRLLNNIANEEEWTVGTSGRDIDWSSLNSPAQGTAVTIATAQIPFKIDV